ncbi:MAG: hypothetical protein ACP5JU_00780 [Minisyncoccia bacterium]
MGNLTGFIQEYCKPDILSQNPGALQFCLQGVYNLCVAIGVLIAFLYFLYGAILYMLSPISDKKADGKSKMFGSLKGLIVIFIFGAILYWVNPNIFNAKLILPRVVRLEVPVELLETEFPKVAQEISQVESYYLPSFNKEKCKDIFNAIDRLVDKGIGVQEGYFNLTKYKLDGKNLTKNQVKALMKALLISESGGQGCYPPNWGRNDIAGYFGTENISKAEINQVLAVLPGKGFSVPKTEGHQYNKNIGGPLDKPEIVAALAIRRLYSYQKWDLIKDPKYSNDSIMAALIIYKAGSERALTDIKRAAIARIINTIKNV